MKILKKYNCVNLNISMHLGGYMNTSFLLRLTSAFFLYTLQVVALPVSIRTLHTHDNRRIILIGDVHLDGRIQGESQHAIDRYYYGWDDLIRSLGDRYVWFIEDPFKQCVLHEEAWYVPSSTTRDLLSSYMMLRTYGLLPDEVRHNIDIRAFTRRRSYENLETLIDLQHEFLGHHKELTLVVQEIEKENALALSDVLQKEYHTKRVSLLSREKSKLEQRCSLVASRLASFTTLYVSALHEKTLPCLHIAQRQLLSAGSSWINSYMKAVVDRTEQLKNRMQHLTYHDDMKDLEQDVFNLECIHVDMLALAAAVEHITHGSKDIVFYMGDAHTTHLASLLERTGLVIVDQRQSCYAESLSVPRFEDDKIPVSKDVVNGNATALTLTIAQAVPSHMLHKYATCILSNFLPIAVIARVFKSR